MTFKVYQRAFRYVFACIAIGAAVLQVVVIVREFLKDDDEPKPVRSIWDSIRPNDPDETNPIDDPLAHGSGKLRKDASH